MLSNLSLIVASIGWPCGVNMASRCVITRSVTLISLLYLLPLLHLQLNIKQELNVYGSFWSNSELTTTSNVFLCEFSLVWDAKLNRRHIGFTDGNLPLRRRYLASKICYYNNSVASYQLQRLVLTGDTGVSLNPGSPEYNDKDEQPTQNSQCFIHASNGNSFLELPYKCLNICHYNICSLTNKLDEIKLLLSSFSNQRKDSPNLILGIAETFLNDSWSDASLAVERFTLFRADRLANRGGGLLVYVPTHLPISRVSDLEMPGIESIWLELHYPRSRPCLFSFIYRPPSADALFFELMDLMLTKVDCKNYRTCILGDFNIDLFSNSALQKRSIALTRAYSFHQLITATTRPVSGISSILASVVCIWFKRLSIVSSFSNFLSTASSFFPKSSAISKA